VTAAVTAAVAAVAAVAVVRTAKKDKKTGWALTRAVQCLRLLRQ
jgi:hypothetical protein